MPSHWSRSHCRRTQAVCTIFGIVRIAQALNRRQAARSELLALASVLFVLAAFTGTSARAATATFSFTGDEQRFTVPAGVTSLHVVAVGGSGGSGLMHPGGSGATAAADVPVVAGQLLFIEVGGNGGSASAGTTSLGGFNGGGNGGPFGGSGEGGGGASDVRILSSPAAGSPASRLIVAGGGGGSTNWASGGAAGAMGEGGFAAGGAARPRVVTPAVHMETA
jgi:hypothetical protein